LEKPVQHFPNNVEAFLSSMNEKQRDQLTNELKHDREMPIKALENLTAELKRLREMGWALTGHIQDFSETARERHRAFLRTGKSAPDIQTPESSTTKAKQPIKNKRFTDEAAIDFLMNKNLLIEPVPKPLNKQMEIL
jgi:hypothetical protein